MCQGGRLSESSRLAGRLVSAMQISLHLDPYCCPNGIIVEFLGLFSPFSLSLSLDFLISLLVLMSRKRNEIASQDSKLHLSNVSYCFWLL